MTPIKLRKTLKQLINDYRLLCTDAFPKNTIISNPSGGCFLWLELKSVLSMDLWWEAMKEGIDFVPGSAHSHSGEFKNCLRISARKHITPEIIIGIHKLGAICHRLTNN